MIPGSSPVSTPQRPSSTFRSLVLERQLQNAQIESSFARMGTGPVNWGAVLLLTGIADLSYAGIERPFQAKLLKGAYQRVVRFQHRRTSVADLTALSAQRWRRLFLEAYSQKGASLEERRVQTMDALAQRLRSIYRAKKMPL